MIRSTRGPDTARWLHEHGGRVADAARMHNVSRNAVIQAWQRLYGAEPLPARARRLAVEARIVELIAQDRTTREAAKETGASLATVFRAMRRAGIRTAITRGTRPRGHARRARRSDRALELLAGGASLAEVIQRTGLSESTLIARIKRAA